MKLTLLLLVVPAFARAEAVSLHDVRVLAQRQAPEVVLATLRVETSRAEIGVAGMLANPTLTLGTATQTARLSTGLSVPLPLFGQRGTAIDAAKADTQTILLEAVTAQWDARWAATQAWVDLWESGARAKLLELAATDAQRLAVIATEKRDAGTGSKLDVLRTTAERDRAVADADAARHQRVAAASRLAPLLGLDDVGLESSGEPSFPATPPELEQLLRTMEAHPVLARDKADLEASRAKVRREERARWPLLTAQVTVNQFDPTLPAPDVMVGLGVDVPVLNLRGPLIERAHAQQSIAETAVQFDERRLRAAVVDAWRRTHAARRQLEALHDKVVPALEEARGLTLEGFELGRLDLLRVLDAQRALLESRLGEAAARAAWARAVADLERAAADNLEEGAARAP